MMKEYMIFKLILLSESPKSIGSCDRKKHDKDLEWENSGHLNGACIEK